MSFFGRKCHHRKNSPSNLLHLLLIYYPFAWEIRWKIGLVIITPQLLLTCGREAPFFAHQEFLMIIRFPKVNSMENLLLYRRNCGRIFFLLLHLAQFVWNHLFQCIIILCFLIHFSFCFLFFRYHSMISVTHNLFSWVMTLRSIFMNATFRRLKL